MSCDDQMNLSEICKAMILDVGKLDCSKYPQKYVNYYLPRKHILHHTQSSHPQNEIVKLKKIQEHSWMRTSITNSKRATDSDGIQYARYFSYDEFYTSEEMIKQQNYSHFNRPCLCKLLIWGYITLLFAALFYFSLIFIFIITSKRTLPSTTTTTSSSSLAQRLTGTNEIIYGVWNTTAGEDSTLSLPGLGIGNFYPYDLPEYALDQNLTTKYTHFGDCSANVYLLKCGEKSGFYLTLRRGASLLVAVQFYTANNNSSYDPLSITIEGSNNSPSTLLLGSNWALIYNGTSGLDVDPGRLRAGALVNLTKNNIWYTSYRLLVTSKRGIYNSVEFAEIDLIGY